MDQFHIWFLLRLEIFFRTTRELELIFCRAKRANFFPEFNIRLYDKNSESDFFFLPPKSEYFFQQHWESEHFFSEVDRQHKTELRT